MVTPAPHLHAAKEDDQKEDRGKCIDSKGYHSQPSDKPNLSGDGRKRPPAVERQNRDQIEELEKRIEESESAEEAGAGLQVDNERNYRGKSSGDGSGKTHASLGQSILRHFLHPYIGAQEGNKTRSGGLNALTPELNHMTKLVAKKQDHEPYREPNAKK